MFSIFKNLATFSVNIKNFILLKKVNSPSIKTKVDLGKNNVFLSEKKPRPKGPYLSIIERKFDRDEDGFFRFKIDLKNSGIEPANNTQTRTEIYISNKLEFISPITANSIIIPGYALGVITQDPKDLVLKCTNEHPDNYLDFIAEYEDSNGNKFCYLHSFWFDQKSNILFTRKEKSGMLAEWRI
jgi:hypothetical protein